MISVTELRAGATFQENGQPYLVLKYEHIKMGRGNANIRVRIKNLEMGTVTERTFVSGAKVEEIVTTKRKLQYLYKDPNGFCFMNPKTFEQISVSATIVGEQGKFLAEGVSLDVLFWDEKALAVELPPKMTFVVTEAGPGIKGDSATNVYKPAVLNNGLQIKVPLFVNSGEKILVDTRTGEYTERVK